MALEDMTEEEAIKHYGLDKKEFSIFKPIGKKKTTKRGV